MRPEYSSQRVEPGKQPRLGGAAAKAGRNFIAADERQQLLKLRPPLQSGQCEAQGVVKRAPLRACRPLNGFGPELPGTTIPRLWREMRDRPAGEGLPPDNGRLRAAADTHRPVHAPT